jgi:hypothetical protein
MNGPFNPLVIAQAVARNIVPLVGILAFHWSAGNVLILLQNLQSRRASVFLTIHFMYPLRSTAQFFCRQVEPKSVRASEMHPLRIAARIYAQRRRRAREGRSISALCSRLARLLT